MNDVPSVSPPGHRLDSWKEIAAYLKRGVTTVQRWERDEDMPVHRHAHASKGSVFAFTGELDEWRERRRRVAADAAATAGEFDEEPLQRREDGPRGRVRPSHLAAVVAVVTLATAAFVFRDAWTSSSPGAPGAVELVRLFAGDELEMGGALSPDGREVVYRAGPSISPESRMWLRAVTGQGRRPLLPPHDVGDDSDPAWSPDGTQVAFRRVNPDGGYDLRVATVGPEPAVSIVVTRMHGDFAWLPSGRMFAITDRGPAGDTFVVQLVDATSGAREAPLTSPQAAFVGDHSVATSPDGRMLVVSRSVALYRSELLVIDLPTRENRRLTFEDGVVTSLDWISDSRAVVYVAWTRAGYRLWRVDVSTGQRVMVQSGRGRLSDISARPGGAGDLLLGTFEATQTELRVARPGRALADRILPAPAGWREAPALSPDRKAIAYVSWHGGAPELWTADADGNNARQLTTMRPSFMNLPRWSPSGGFIAMSATVNGNEDVFIVDARGGSEPRRLTDWSGRDAFPSWSADGQWIHFGSDRGGDTAIYKMAVTGGVATRVASGMRALESLDGRWLYFTRSPVLPGLWKLRVSGGYEEFVTPHVLENYWDVVDDGVVYLDVLRARPTDAARLKRYRASDRVVADLGTAGLPSAFVLFGLGAAPDLSQLLYTTTAPRQSYLVFFELPR